MLAMTIELRNRFQEAGRAPTGALPGGVLLGAATSAYQIEGATTADGRGESIWDQFTRRPGAIDDGTTGERACEHYTRWEGDVALMSELGLGAYGSRSPGRGGARRTWSGQRGRPRLLRPARRRAPRCRDRAVADAVPLGTPSAAGGCRRVAGAGDGQGVRRLCRGRGRAPGRPGRHLDDAQRAVRGGPHGYVTGEHAPGRRDSGPDSPPAITFSSATASPSNGSAPSHPRPRRGSCSTSPQLSRRAPIRRMSSWPVRVDDLENRWFVEPIAGLGYPPRGVERFDWPADEVADGDLALISRPITCSESTTTPARSSGPAAAARRRDRRRRWAGRSTPSRSGHCCAGFTIAMGSPAT